VSPHPPHKTWGGGSGLKRGGGNTFFGSGKASSCGGGKGDHYLGGKRIEGERGRGGAVIDTPAKTGLPPFLS